LQTNASLRGRITLKEGRVGKTLLSDAVPQDGRIWLKSEWGPASQDWPAVSFSKRSVGETLRREFLPQRDVLIYVGTSNPQFTEDAKHRQRLLSAVRIEPKQLLETRDCIPSASWEQAQRDFRGRWFWSMPALNIWDIETFPRAYDVCPNSYGQLGLIVNRGNVVEVMIEERPALLQLELRSVSFVLPEKAGEFTKTRAFLNLSHDVRADIARMARGILGRVATSGSQETRFNPVRMMGETDINVMLGTKWCKQEGRCFLCQGQLLPGTKNYLLQCSPDRMDSQDINYNEANTRITHLGCNLAKNKVTLSDFEDWCCPRRAVIHISRTRSNQ
jgi:hypothetical protein